ncbi:MAG TPA: DUF58 domain-containing protein [Gemmatimonadaceae bacterium]|nr:DUF58 domain-containing protein [Gemmatimonadaceae bacterium]
MNNLIAPGAQLLDPNVLARIGNLEMRAKGVVEGFIQGLHRAPNLGASTDFAEHRPYMPGDDTRRVDWRLFARTDRHYVKEFEADTNTNFVVFLDVSRSMAFGNKMQYACTLAACLAYFSSLQRDRVGLVTFAQKVVDYVPPSAKHLRLVLHSLDNAERGIPKEPVAVSTRYRQLFQRMSDTVRRRSMIAIISDLYEEPEDVVSAVNTLRGRGNDIMVLHVLDPRERQFPFEQAGMFVDLESGETMPIIPDYLRDEYQKLMRTHIDTLGRRLGSHNVDYGQFDTSQPMDRALFKFLGARNRFERARKVG